MSNTETKTIYRQLGISEDVWDIWAEDRGRSERTICRIDSNAEYNQLKVISTYARMPGK